MTRTLSLTRAIVPGLLLMVGISFALTGLQGNNGLLQRIQVVAERERLAEDLEALREQVAAMEVLTRRLSDDYLDLDLLDERARNVLGYVRPDEIVLP